MYTSARYFVKFLSVGRIGDGKRRRAATGTMPFGEGG